MATLVALLMLCWGLAEGTWRVFKPELPVAAFGDKSGFTDLRALANTRLFGRAATTEARRPVAEAPVAPSALNLTVTGVLMRAAGGCALVVPQGQPEAAVCVGEEIIPGVRLDTVLNDRILIVRNGVREAVIMKDAVVASGSSVAPVPIVQSMGAGRQVVDRQQLQKQLNRPEFLSQALIVPNPGGGGFLVRRVQAGSLYEKLGLRQGDVIRKINGQPLTNMKDVMSLYQQFGTAQRVLVDVQRQGRTETLYYDMR